MALEPVTVGGDQLYAGIIVVSAIVSFPLALFGLLAYRRRRTMSYLFVASAFVAFLLKSVVGILGLLGLLSMESHHLIEHGLDILVGVLLIGAVYLARDSKRFEGLPFDESS